MIYKDLLLRAWERSISPARGAITIAIIFTITFTFTFTRLYFRTASFRTPPQ